MNSPVTNESTVHQQLCDYVRLQYPGLLFRTDYAAGLHLTMYQAKVHKRLQSGRAWPDFALYEPRAGYHGLFIEIKRDGTRLYTKTGKPTTPHLAEQYEVLQQLLGRGYYAAFGVGFEACRKLVDTYLSWD